MNTMRQKYVIGNEDGSVLILSLVILAVLLIIGMSATTTSNIENLITRNVEEYTVALYRAEAAAMVAAQNLENADPNPRDDPDLDSDINPDSWLYKTVVSDIFDDNNWTNAEPVDINVNQNPEIISDSRGIVEGSSLDMAKSNVYGYTAYGRGRGDRGGVVIVGVGYRRAF